jgi:hypothetical protein
MVVCGAFEAGEIAAIDQGATTIAFPLHCRRGSAIAVLETMTGNCQGPACHKLPISRFLIK